MIRNIMGLALSVVGRQPVMWERFRGRTENRAGYWEKSYYPAQRLKDANVQPIPQKMYQALGLDFGKQYMTLYTPAGVVAADRDECGDRITWGGVMWVAESDTDWSQQAGWTAITCVRVKEPV
jgi:hypothetical protein